MSIKVANELVKLAKSLVGSSEKFEFAADVVKDGVYGLLVNIRVISPVVDRPHIGAGFRINDKKLVPRLVKAIEDGAVTANPIIREDVNYKTYVDVRLKVRGRFLNSDLKKLGY